ncbi:MAG: PKD domain-containing protein [bacterium]|nr:PKD domain-containing protein [bacterium]
MSNKIQMAKSKIKIIIFLILSITLLCSYPSYAIMRDTVMRDAYVFSTASWTCIAGNANTTYNYFTVGGQYTGIPYNWGGYESVSSAFYKLSIGRIAGDSKIFGAVSSSFAGVDCSGYVSTCWRSGRYTTSTLENICKKYPITWTDLIRGDVTNKAGSHVRLFDCYTTGTNQIMFYEATAGVKPCRVVYRVLSKDTTYKPLRYDKIEDGPLPVAGFYGTPVNGAAPLSVNFYDTSSGTPTGWGWTFGDGSSATVQNPAHLYLNPGNYTVTLIARNAYGVSTVTRTNYIVVGIKPTASFYGTPTAGPAPLLVQFYDTSTNAPTSWYWTFGDGSTSAVMNPSQLYTTPGNYPVTLIASNQYGSSTAVKPNYIMVATPPVLELNRYGEFTVSSDTIHWYFEVYGDGTGAGMLMVDTTAGYIVIEQIPGQKGKLTQVFSVPSTGWYTAKTKVWTTIGTPNQQQKVYLYLQELDSNTTVVATGNQVIQPGSGYFGGAGNQKEMQISFYTQSTLMGVQLVAINPSSSGVAGGLYADYVWVTPGAPQPTAIIFSDSFDSGTAGWLFQPYGDAASAGTWLNEYSNLILTQAGGQKGKASKLFNLTTTAKPVSASVWVYSDVSALNKSQKIYLYLYDYTTGYTAIIDSGNAILQPGKWWTPDTTWRQLQFIFTPSSLYNALQLVGINPEGNDWAGLYFDALEVKQD